MGGRGPEARAIKARFYALPRPVPDEAADAYLGEVCVVRDRIADTPSRTLVGAAEQVRLVLECDLEGCVPGECEIAALENALATLDALAGRA